MTTANFRDQAKHALLADLAYNRGPGNTKAGPPNKDNIEAAVDEKFTVTFEYAEGGEIVYSMLEAATISSPYVIEMST